MRARPALAAIIALAACKRAAEPAPAAAPAGDTRAAALTDDQRRARNTLTITERAGAFELTDGAHQMSVTLPQRPTLDSRTVAEEGVEVFNSQAVMPGGPVDVQFGAITVLDDALPPALLQQMSALPAQLASATGGTLTRNEAGTLAGAEARIFEIATGDQRRLFGWYTAVPAHARMYQLNCVGPDDAGVRAACAAVAQSFKLSP
jgi:hypothetical protein